MSYRCDICKDTVPAGDSLRKHTVRHTFLGKSQILRELPVCKACEGLLVSLPLATVRQQRGKLAELATGFIITVTVGKNAKLARTGKITPMPIPVHLLGEEVTE